MLNPEVLKCHEDLITLETRVQQIKTIDNKFFICGTHQHLWIFGGLGGFNNQTGPILVHIYTLFYINLHVKYRSNRIKNLLSFLNKKNTFFFLFRGHVGPLHKIQGYQGHRNVSKCSPQHNGDICTTRGNTCNLKTSFSYLSQNVKKMYILGYTFRLGLSCFPAILSPISMYMSNKETI